MNAGFKKSLKTKTAFTLIELLVVITIINLLSSVVFVSAASARRNQRMVKRVSELLEIRKALEIYNLRNNGVYPSTCAGGPTTQCPTINITTLPWYSECSGGGFTPQPKDQWIPLLVSQGYMRALPVDPFVNITGGLSCYAYKSTGKDYKVMIYNIQDNPAVTTADYLTQLQFLDPARDANAAARCSIETTGTWGTPAWAIYSEGTLTSPNTCAGW